MNYIYLDTAHLLKWHNNSLSLTALKKLNTIFSNEENLLIISPQHLKEILNIDDLDKVRDFFKFINRFNCIYSGDEHYLLRYEFMNAISCFNGSHLKKFNFAESFFLSDEEIDFLISGKELGKINRSIAFEIFSRIQEEMKALVLNKEQRTARIKRTFDEAVREKIYEYKLYTVKSMDDFISFVRNNPNILISFKINYFMTCALSADSTRTPKLTDWIDIEHAYFLPHVNYFSLDGDMKGRITGIISKYGLPIKTTINSDIDQLFA